MTDDRLLDLFRAYGEITEAAVAVGRLPALAKGFGFVQFAVAGAARTAIGVLDGRSVDGRAIHMDIAQPRTVRLGDNPRREGGSR